MSGLSLRAIDLASRRRSNRWHTVNMKDWSLSDWAVATAGELGEALNVVKKLNRERDGIVGNKQSKEELEAVLAEELADTLLYLVLLAAAANVDLERAVIEKFNRVSRENGFPEMLPEPPNWEF